MFFHDIRDTAETKVSIFLVFILLTYNAIFPYTGILAV